MGLAGKFHQRSRFHEFMGEPDLTALNGVDIKQVLGQGDHMLGLDADVGKELAGLDLVDLHLVRQQAGDGNDIAERAANVVGHDA